MAKERSRKALPERGDQGRIQDNPRDEQFPSRLLLTSDFHKDDGAERRKDRFTEKGSMKTQRIPITVLALLAIGLPLRAQIVRIDFTATVTDLRGTVPAG